MVCVRKMRILTASSWKWLYLIRPVYWPRPLHPKCNDVVRRLLLWLDLRHDDSIDLSVFILCLGLNITYKYFKKWCCQCTHDKCLYNVTPFASAQWEQHCHDWMNTLLVKLVAMEWSWLDDQAPTDATWWTMVQFRTQIHPITKRKHCYCEVLFLQTTDTLNLILFTVNRSWCIGSPWKIVNVVTVVKKWLG